MPDELRLEFHQELEKIDRQVLGLFALVGECDFEYPRGSFMRCNDWVLEADAGPASVG